MNIGVNRKFYKVLVLRVVCIEYEGNWEVGIVDFLFFYFDLF